MPELDEMPDPQPLADAVSRLDEPLRKLGIYVAQSLIMPTDMGLVATVDGLIGDAALSARVQNPAQAASDDVLRQMQHEQQKSEFEATREEMLRRVAEGKPLFEDEG